MRMFRDGLAYEVNLSQATEADLIDQLPFLKDWGVFSILKGATLETRIHSDVDGKEDKTKRKLYVHLADDILAYGNQCGMALPQEILLMPDENGEYYTIVPLDEEPADA